MKQGRTINGLAQELERRASHHKDFKAPTNKLSIFAATDNTMSMGGLPLNNPTINHHALRQIGTHQNIPAKYVDHMLEHSPQLLATNINHWFQQMPSTRLLRTDEHGVRAFLSDKYRVIDNDDIAEMVLPVLMSIPNMNVISCEVTDRRLYIKAVTPRIKGEVVIGQEVQAGVTITNSEVGLGSVSVKPMAYFLWCLNGCTTGKGLSRYHIGRGSETGDDVREVMTDEAHEADDKALLLKLRDVLSASISKVHFNRSLDKFRNAKTISIGDPIDAVELVEKKGWLSKGEGQSVLKHLIEGADLSAFGMSNAITRASQDFESYDRASELETLGGTIIELPKSAWQETTMAA